MTLGGSGRAGAHRGFSDRERGAGTVKSQGWSSPEGWSPAPLPIPARPVVLERVGCRRRGGQAGSWSSAASVYELNQKGSQQGDPGDKVTSEPSIRWLGAAPLGSDARRALVSGSYFANHFIMGGEKFDSTHPEGYLFGENSDLNFLGNRPVVVGTGGSRAPARPEPGRLSVTVGCVTG